MFISLQSSTLEVINALIARCNLHLVRLDAESYSANESTLFINLRNDNERVDVFVSVMHNLIESIECMHMVNNECDNDTERYVYKNLYLKDDVTIDIDKVVNNINSYVNEYKDIDHFLS